MGGQEQIDGGDIFIDETSTPILNLPFEECTDGASEKFPEGKFTIRNKENGLFLSVVDGALAFTEVKDTNSDWFLVDGNEEWGTIRNYDLGKVLNMKDCGIDSCPVGLYSNNLWNGYGYLTAYQRWRRSGDKIVGALPGYLAQDNSGNLVVKKSETDGNKDWIKLEIGPSIPGSLEHGGKDCWNGCNKKQGKCNWCGADGFCCKMGWIGNECDGSFGGPYGHQCVLNTSQNDANTCTKDHPFAYLNGQYCCETNQEKVNGGTSNEVASGTCDGIGFSIESTCCKYNKYLKCPHTKCKDYGDQNDHDALKNGGKDCWNGCNKKQGKCDWCGADGFCCR